MERISSRRNRIVERFREVVRKGSRDGLMLLDGVHLIEEAIRAGVGIDVIAFRESSAGREIDDLLQRVARAGTRVLCVTDPVLTAMSPAVHPAGIVAIAHRPAAALDDVLGVPPQLVPVVAHVQDPGNVGAVVRVAEACGATGLIATAGTADPFGWKALRGGMGSTFRLPLARIDSLDGAMEAASRRRVRRLAAVPRGGRSIRAVDFTLPTMILLGGEGAGLDADAVAAADERITIPMKPPVESLNVATAAALILYEAARQRGS